MTEPHDVTSTPHTSKNNIFTASWRAIPPPPPPSNTSQGHVVLLGRSKTTGGLSKWRLNASRTWQDLESDKDIESIDPTRAWDGVGDDRAPRPVTVVPTGRDEGESQLDLATRKKEPPPPLKLNRTKSFFDSPLRNHHISPLTPPQPPSSSFSTTTFDHSPISPALTRSTGTSSASTTTTHSLRNPSLSVLLPQFSKLGSHSASDNVESEDVPIEVRYFPADTFTLGSGRYSTVLLGSWRSQGTGERSNHGDDKSSVADEWALCALKRMEDDLESQELGLREAWFLRHIAAAADVPHGGKAYVVRILGLKRESQVVSQIPKAEAAIKHHSSRSFLNLVDYSRFELPKLRHSRHSSMEEYASSLHSPGAFQQAHHPWDDRLILVLEHAATTLSDIIHSSPQHLTRKQHTTIAFQLSTAVSFLHSQGILHTDIKPHNVLLTSKLEVRLADFNTAIHVPSLPSFMSPPDDPVGLGTPTYSPPEFNRPPPSPFLYPSDIWALGVSLMVAIVGREPYERLAASRRSHELKLWLKKGAYWVWEEQQRLDAIENAAIYPSRSTRAELDKPKIDEEQLRAVLGDSYRPNQSLEPVMIPPSELPDHSHVKSSPSHLLDLQPYNDGSPALHYLGSPHRVSQNMIDILQKMCSSKPDTRPTAEQVVNVFRQEVHDLAET